MTSLKVIFMGTPDFAVPTLRALQGAGHKIVAVYCQPPRPTGRGEKIQKKPVHVEAENCGLCVYTPLSLSNESVVKEFQSHGADIAVVVAYGLLLPKAILESVPMGCVNIHASLLPRWRGAAPIQRAIEAGDAETGITIMRMDTGLDTGDILMTQSVPLDDTVTGQSLHETLSQLGARLIVETLEALAKGKIHAIPQPIKGVTYAQKLSREESRIDWSVSAITLARKVRAFTPWPGMYFLYQGKRIKIIEACAEITSASHLPGTVLKDPLRIACGEGYLRLLKVQKEGKAPMDALDFLNGTSIPEGTRLE